MTFEAALTFALAVFIFGITPGPGVFAIMARALVNGSGSCFFLALGMTISDILYLIAACFGLAAIATHWAELFLAIRVLGACYLFYLGWKIWTTRAADSHVVQGRKSKNQILSFIQGFLISISNPKVILFYIAFLPTFLDVSSLAGTDIVLVSFLTLFSLMLGLNLIAFFAAKASRFFGSERGQKYLNRSAGSIMMSAGAFLLLKS